MNETTIRLEIWVGDHDDAIGHEQTISIDDLRLLGQIIGEKDANWLIDEYVSRITAED